MLLKPVKWEICLSDMSFNIVDFQLAIKYPDAG